MVRNKYVGYYITEVRGGSYSSCLPLDTAEEHMDDSDRRMTEYQARVSWRLAHAHKHEWAVLLTEDLAVAVNELGGPKLISVLVRTVRRMEQEGLRAGPGDCIDRPEWCDIDATMVCCFAAFLRWTIGPDSFWLTVLEPDPTEPSALLSAKRLTNGDVLSWTRSDGPHRVDQVDVLRGALAAAIPCSQEQAERYLAHMYDSAAPAKEDEAPGSHREAPLFFTATGRMVSAQPAMPNIPRRLKTGLWTHRDIPNGADIDGGEER